MSRRDDFKGYLLIDERGRVAVIGDALRETLREISGYYTHLPSDKTLLHFQRVANPPALDEFRDPILLSGDIAGMGSTVEVINFVNAARLSGNLVFVSNDVRTNLYFKDGVLRGAASSRVVDRLLEVMYRFGTFERADLEQATADSRAERRSFGKHLLEKGLVTQADLYMYMKRQVEEIFYSTLAIAKGDFYLTKFDVDGLRNPLSLNAQSLLMEGLRRMDEMTYYQQKIPHTGVRVARGKPTDGVSLQPRERAIVKAVSSEPRSVEEILQACRLGHFDGLHTIFHLVQAGFVRIIDDGPASESAEVADEASAEMIRMVDTFNAVFTRISQAISRRGHQDALDQGLATFLQFYGFVELFQGVRFGPDGALDKMQLLANLKSNPVDNRLSFLSQALNELLFYEMFTAREWLARDEQRELQAIINQL